MKRLVMILILGLLPLGLGACSENNADTNTISAGKLTERENMILATISDKSFVFDFNIDSEYDEIVVWVEKYESGNQTDEKLGYLTTQVEQNGSIIFTLSKSENEKNNIFHIGVGTDGSIASINGSDTNLNDLENMDSVWGNIPEKAALENGEVILASICYSDDDNGMHSLTTAFYEDAENHMNELEEYDVVYLLKAEFIK